MKCFLTCMGFVLMYLGTPGRVSEPNQPVDPRELYDFTVEHHAFLRSYFGCPSDAMTLDKTTCFPGKATFDLRRYEKARKLAKKVYGK